MSAGKAQFMPKGWKFIPKGARVRLSDKYIRSDGKVVPCRQGDVTFYGKSMFATAPHKIGYIRRKARRAQIGAKGNT